MYLLSCQQLIELLGMCQRPQKVRVGPCHPAQEPLLLSKRQHEPGSEPGSLPVHELQVLLLEAAVLLAVGSRVLFQLRHPLLQKDNLGTWERQGSALTLLSTPQSDPRWSSDLAELPERGRLPLEKAVPLFNTSFYTLVSECLLSRSTGPNASLFPFFTTRS